jgi:RimJ/RimL family protein N-acetyltransferase
MINFRKLGEDDLLFLNETRNEYCEEYLHDSRKFTLSETKKWFSDTNPNFYLILNGGEKIGYFRLSNYSEKNKNIYIGADINSKYKGQGYGKLSYIKFIPYLFKHYNLNKISLEVLSTNKIAINLYKKLGFVQEGIKREEILKNDVWVDSIVMSILYKEYKDNKL